MQINETGIEGLVEIIPSVFSDSRGWFYEFYKQESFEKNGITTRFVQENQSYSQKGVIRGLHFQREPYAQAKLVTVISGKALDVAVDLRKNSKTFGKVFSVVLDSQKHNMLMIPEGFAHGFSALEDTIFFYKCSNVFNKPSEGGIVWNDPDLNIDWQVKNPIVSQKDAILPTFKEFKQNQ